MLLATTSCATSSTNSVRLVPSANKASSPKKSTKQYQNPRYYTVPDIERSFRRKQSSAIAAFWSSHVYFAIQDHLINIKLILTCTLYDAGVSFMNQELAGLYPAATFWKS
ncbi:hypothetical protein ACN47E_002945 [Coniothyrium glycines]